MKPRDFKQGIWYSFSSHTKLFPERSPMKKRCCSVLSMVVTLTSATTAFAGSPRTSDGRETRWPSPTPKSSDPVALEFKADNTWWRPNLNEMKGEDTLGPWQEPSVSTGKRWESKFSDCRLKSAWNITISWNSRTWLA